MLSRTIGSVQSTALVVGIIIGASIFVQPSVITGTVPSLGAVYAVWIAAGALTLCGALIAAELASAYPQAGGVYVFLREAFSPSVAFLWGWAMFWTMHTGIIAAIAMVFARYAAVFVPMGDAGMRLTAVVAILALSVVNYLGVRQGSLLHTAITIAKVGAVVAIIVLVFAIGPRTAPAATASATGPLTAHTFALALVAGLFAFGGWHMVTYAAEETTEPERTIPRALGAGVLLVTACYLALNAAYFHVLSPRGVATSSHVAADAADAMFGRGGAAVMAAVVAMSTFGAVNGIILAGPRVYLSMARDRLLFHWAAAIHPRFHTPHRAILLQAVWACVLVSTDTYKTLFTRVVYTEWLFFALMALGLLRLRSRAGYAPRWRLRGVPAVPLVFALVSLYVVVNQLVSDPRNSLQGLGLIAAGFPVYILWLRKSAVPEATSAET